MFNALMFNERTSFSRSEKQAKFDWYAMKKYDTNKIICSLEINYLILNSLQ